MWQVQVMPQPSFVVAVVGAECTGKSTLVAQMQAALLARGTACTTVPEELRGFCARMGRTPRADEQQAIALDQTAAITRAAMRHPVVIADTTALMTAVYSEQVFGDSSLTAQAVCAHRSVVGLTLLAATDLPWRGDGFQRDGPAARMAVDRLLRQALDHAGISYAVITGDGLARQHAAMAALRRAMAAPPHVDAARWRYRCRRCDRVDGGLPVHAAAAVAPAELATVANVGQDLRTSPGVPDTTGAQCWAY